ncbi:GerAB/ArcD/ProY family transporter [Paenibacillus sp. Root444D2]|uniref:GerAB/ArcD/ProY family transporter n=1 Tax=Paenibacillus sp. Root444D2 TaxID=1736538 RepID=UPI00070D17BA|nr:endospore germination permease [Paenibacillus sp. Root444D2]KQX44666.1 hypothetical protein ASD40_21970 [Paenibacillus sp. Root444D2]
MIKQLISTRQATMWFTLYQLGSALLILPAALAGISKQDAWISVVVAIGLFLSFSPVYIKLASQMKGNDVIVHLTYLIGRFPAKISLFFFLMCFPFLTFTLVLDDLGAFLTTSIIPETPNEAIYLLMIIAVICVVRAGVTVAGRVAELLFFAYLILIIIGYSGLLPVFKIDNILPILEYGFKPVIHGSLLLLAFPYLEGVLFLFFAPHVQDQTKWKSIILKSTMMSGITFLVITLLVIGTLSEGVTANLTYPSYFVLRTVIFADIYERFEQLFAVLWYITIFFRLSLLLHVVSHGLAGIFQLKNAKSLTIPLSFIAFTSAKDIFPNYPAVMLAFQVWPFYILIFGMLLPIVILILGWMKRRGAQTN